MNLLLRLTERRSIAAAILLLAAVATVVRWGAWAHPRFELWLHPPAEAYTMLAAPLLKDSDARQSARLRGLHREVSREIQAAAALGFNVDKLQRLADAALALDSAAYRSVAFENLNKLRLSVPRKKDIARPEADDAGADEVAPPRQRRRARRQ